MSERDSAAEVRRRILSALADGEASADDASLGFAAWRDDADARRTWHAYQLIGDAMRSDDLAGQPQRDSALLLAVRARLAQEPVVLAPVAGPAPPLPLAPAARGRAIAWARGHWQAPAAMATGFLLVVGGLTALSGPSDPDKLAFNAPAVVPGVPPAAPPVALPPTNAIAPYLAAHRQSTLAAPFQMPDAGVRSVSYTRPAP